MFVSIMFQLLLFNDGNGDVDDFDDDETIVYTLHTLPMHILPIFKRVFFKRNTTFIWLKFLYKIFYN